MKISKLYQIFQLLISGTAASYILYLGLLNKDQNFTIFASLIPISIILFASMFKKLRDIISESQTSF